LGLCRNPPSRIGGCLICNIDDRNPAVLASYQRCIDANLIAINCPVCGAS